MSPLGYFHTFCGAVALWLGLLIFLSTKGTRAHVWAGRGYVASMVCVNVTALMLYNLTGTFNVFHVLAIVSLVMVLAGWIQAFGRRRFRRWMWRHYQYMAWSYVGLVAATSNEAFVRIPALAGLTSRASQRLPFLVMLAIVASSGLLIFSLQQRVLARYSGQAERPEERGGSS